MNRRSFIKLGTIGAVSTTMLPELAATAERENKALVWIWLGGGISHIEFTHPIPNAPVEFRNVNGVIQTKGDYLLGGDFVNLAGIGNLLTPVTSFGHRDANHYTATHWMMTGWNGAAIPENGPQKEPSYGSIISSLYGANAQNGISTYVKTSKIAHDDAVWLGATHMGFECSKEGIDNLKLNIAKERFLRRNQMADIVDRRGDYLYAEHSKLRKQAVDVVMGDAGAAFEIEKEPDSVKNQYRVATSRFGQNLLLARRVIEAGTKFVTVTNDGWDMHGDIAPGMANRVPELDYCLTQFILDLQSRGLLERTLIVVASEFGRTSKINMTAGRDHQNSLISLLFAGGNYSHGSRIGSYDDKALSSTSNLYNPFDLTATIFDHFNLDIKHKFVDNIQRPRYITEGETRVILKG